MQIRKKRERVCDPTCVLHAYAPTFSVSPPLPQGRHNHTADLSGISRPFLPLTWGLLLASSQHVATVKGARQAARWFIGSPSAMLSLGKWLSSKARLVLVLFTGLGRADLNYLRLPLVNTTETRRVCVCVCVQEGWTEDGRQEWRSGRCRGRDGGKKNKWAIMSCCFININHNNKWLCACLNSSPFSSLFTLHRVTLH